MAFHGLPWHTSAFHRLPWPSAALCQSTARSTACLENLPDLPDLPLISQVRQTAELENLMISVERLTAYHDLPQEAALRSEQVTSHDLPLSPTIACALSRSPVISHTLP